MAEFGLYSSRRVTLCLAAHFPSYSRGHLSIASVHAARERLRAFVADNGILAAAYHKTVCSHTFDNDVWSVEVEAEWSRATQESIPTLADIASTYGSLEQFFHDDQLLSRTSWCGDYHVCDRGASE